MSRSSVLIALPLTFLIGGWGFVRFCASKDIADNYSPQCIYIPIVRLIRSTLRFPIDTSSTM